VRAPLTPQEEEVARLSMKPGVGGAFARGDFGVDEETLTDLTRLADADAGSDTGIAAALVLANGHASPLRDLRSGECLRERDQKAAQNHFVRAADAAMAQGSWGLVRLATAVAAPTEAGAPVLDLAQSYLGGGKGKGKGKSKEKKALAAAVDAPYGQAEGADLLNGIRRTFASF
jgi:hypothetical protein